MKTPLKATIIFRCTEETKAELTETAARQGLTVAALMTQIITDWRDANPLHNKAVEPAKPPVEHVPATGAMSAAAPAPQPFKRAPALAKTDTKTPAEPLPDWCRLKKTPAKSTPKPQQTPEIDPFEEF